MPIAIMMIMTFYGYKNQGVILHLVKTEKQFAEKKQATNEDRTHDLLFTRQAL